MIYLDDLDDGYWDEDDVYVDPWMDPEWESNPYLWVDPARPSETVHLPTEDVV